MSQTSGSTAEKTVNWTVAVLLIVAQGVASLVVGTLSLFFMMISDGCHDGPDDPFICSNNGGLFFFGGLALEWLLLAAGFVASIVLSILAANNGKTVWFRPLIGIGIGLLGVVIMVITVGVSAS